MILELLSLRLNLNWSVAEATFGDRRAGTSLLFPPHRAARWQQKALILQIARKKLSLRLRSRTNSSLQSLFLLFSGGWERREGKNRWKRRENCARRRCQFRPTCVSWYFADVEKFFFWSFASHWIVYYVITKDENFATNSLVMDEKSSQREKGSFNSVVQQHNI